MKVSFLDRLSNVLSWLGFVVTVLTILNSISDLRFDPSIWLALGFQGFLAIVNYLMVGRFRLLPWRDIEDQE
jgi:uncharacterized membrane protein